MFGKALPARPLVGDIYPGFSQYTMRFHQLNRRSELVLHPDDAVFDLQTTEDPTVVGAREFSMGDGKRLCY